jgi:Tetratricopeptide repeat
MNRVLSALVVCAGLAGVALAARGAGAAPDNLAVRVYPAAEAAFAASHWEDAARLYQELADDNPRQGRFWYRLATAEYNLKHYDASVDHYRRAIDVGFEVGTSYYNIGCCLALEGNHEADAIDALELAIRNGLRNREDLLRTDSDLASLRESKAFRERILPSVTPKTSRADGWRMDLAYLSRRVAETHYDPFRNISREDWDREVARISKNVPKMSDHEIIVAMMQLVARLHDGHSVVAAPIDSVYGFHTLPIDFYDFKDGFFVRGADPAYAALVGKRVVRIGEMPIRDALDRVATTVQRDNSQQIRWLAARYLQRVEILDALGVVHGTGPVIVTVADDGGRETSIAVTPVAMNGDREPVGIANFTDMSAGAAAPLPLWRQHPDRNYWFEYFPDSRVVYMKFRVVIDQDNDETLAQFSDRLFDFIDAHPVDALVIDVRLNHGGNNFLGRALWIAIQRSKTIMQPNHLFVITGRETFSACQNFCNWIERDTKAVFVGEATGSKPNFVGEGNLIVLPYSGVIANASSRLWQDSVSEDRRQWIAPAIAAEMTSEDYRTNRDPALDAVLEYLHAVADSTSTSN